jgi:hypothetical protein
MTEITQQDEMALTRATAIDVPDERIKACRTAGQAIRLAVQAGLVEDKEVYIPLGYDAGTWTRITKDQANLSWAKLPSFCSLVRNTVVLRWICFSMGYVPVLMKTEAEQRLEEVVRMLAERDAQIGLLKGLLRNEVRS